MNVSHLRTLGVSLAIGVLIVPASAHAYLDPGTGSLIVQALIGGAVAVGFFLKTQWHRVKRFVGRLFGGKPDASPKSSAKKPSSKPRQ